MSKTYSDLTGAELLRADYSSQKVYITDENGDSKSIVNENHFWGHESSDVKLYFNFKDKRNKGWSVRQDGWNDYTEEKSRHLSPDQTEELMYSKVFCDNVSTLSVIQGYAGCGKTIFVNSFLRNQLRDQTSISYNDIYIDYDNNATENGYLPSSIRNHFIRQLFKCLLEDSGLEIYEKFFQLLVMYSDSSASFSNLLPLFKHDSQISNLTHQIFDNREDKEKIELIQSEFVAQIISGISTVSGALKNKILFDENIDIYDLTSIEEDHIKTLLEFYLLMDLILQYAIIIIKNQKKGIIFYDNLDIIDNPHHIDFFINKLQKVLHSMSRIFTKKNNFSPIFNVIVAVRKITFTYISTFKEVHDIERGFDNVHVNFLDISNLYSSTQLLKHKAQVLLNGFQDYIPEKYNRNDVKKFLETLIQIPEKALKEICLSDLFNHNIRACANILEQAMTHFSHIVPKEIDTNTMSEKCSSTLWIHNICAALHKNEVWHNLGYNTSDKEEINFPTTLSRLILTYLYNQRRGYRDKKDGFETIEVSFKKIVEVFEKLPFSCFPRQHANIPMETKKNYSKENTHKRIVTTLSNMLKRNTESDGINPKNEMEIWRRPLYFTKNAFPLTDKNGNDNIKNELNQQLINLNRPNASFTEFCITDEGYTFIEKIATNFEFYSVRYNSEACIPLCCIREKDILDEMIGNVYQEVKKCIENHQWIMEFYIRKYGQSHFNSSNLHYKSDVNNYLLQMFHPRTEGYKPQLHIVRTLYNHIDYMNDCRDYLISINHENLPQLNKCLVQWIGKYLELYSRNLYLLLDNTIGSFNEVFLDLKYLYWRIINSSDYLPCVDNGSKKISISRSDAWLRKSSSHQISIDKLQSDSMLIT